MPEVLGSWDRPANSTPTNCNSTQLLAGEREAAQSLIRPSLVQCHAVETCACYARRKSSARLGIKKVPRLVQQHSRLFKGTAVSAPALPQQGSHRTSPFSTATETECPSRRLVGLTRRCCSPGDDLQNETTDHDRTPSHHLDRPRRLS